MDEVVTFVRDRFSALANPHKARDMAAYMKTDMPFYGVQKPDRVPILREMKSRFPIDSARKYATAVLALWRQPHREEKYAALFLAQAWPRFIVPASLPLYRRLIVEGAWWDFVDDVAIRLAGIAWLNHRAAVDRVMDRWINHRSMWLRRAAIIGQIKHGSQTDESRLFEYSLRRAHENEFFIRKAIGWALREHAKTNPRAVTRFLQVNHDRLSPLSFHEAAKHLKIER